MAANYEHPTVNPANENGDEEAPAPPQPTTEPTSEPTHLQILFKDQHGNDVHFKLKPSTKLGKAMAAYSAKAGADPKSLRFLFEGERVLEDSTPESLGLIDGEAVEVHMEQIGGGGKGRGGG